MIDVNDELVSCCKTIEIEDHPRHVRGVGERLGEPIGVPGLDGELGGRGGEIDLALRKLGLRRGDLAVEVLRLRLLRRNHEEPRGREQGDASDSTERDHRLLLLQQAVHQEPPVFRSAAIWKWTTDFVPLVSTSARRERHVAQCREGREPGKQTSHVGLGIRVAVDLRSGRGCSAHRAWPSRHRNRPCSRGGSHLRLERAQPDVLGQHA